MHRVAFDTCAEPPTLTLDALLIQESFDYHGAHSLCLPDEQNEMLAEGRSSPAKLVLLCLFAWKDLAVLSGKCLHQSERYAIACL